MKNNIEFFYTDVFEHEYKRLKKKYPSISGDIRLFKEELIKNPNAGTDLGSGLKKIRVQIRSKNKGKSGGARIITYNLVIEILQRKVVLITIFDKSETENIPMSKIRTILKRNGY